MIRMINTRTFPGNWKTVEHESDSDTNCNQCFWYSHQRIDSGTEELGNKRTSEDHPNYSIFKIDQATEESPGKLRRLLSLKLQ